MLFAVIVLAWISIFAVLLHGGVRRRTSGDPVSRDKKSASSFWGLAFQGVALCILLVAPRSESFSGESTGALWLLVVVPVAVAAVWLVRCSVRELGSHWSLIARVGGDHRLVTGGLYGLVRHPIYAATFLMLIVTGLAIGSPVGFVVAVSLFLSGTFVRIHCEETLLRATLGAEFDRYQETVPVLMPWRRGR